MAKKKSGKPAAKKKAGPKPTRGRKASKKASRKKIFRKKASPGKAPTGKTSRRNPATRKSSAPARGKTAVRKKTAARKKKKSRKPARSVSRKAAPRARRGERKAAFFEHFRQRLLEERQRIGRRLDELQEELRGLAETTPREMEEWAQEEKDRDILIRLEEREAEELRRIQAALGLIDEKEYGRCQVCGKPIPRARLEELPTAFRCIEHTP